MVFDAILSNIDEALLINPSANVFIFGDFNVHHKNWLTYSGGTERPGELCYTFLISNNLIFPTQIPDYDSQFCSNGFIYFFQPQYLFYSGFPSIEKFLLCCVSAFIDFPSNSKGHAPVHHTANDYSRGDWCGILFHFRDVLRRISLSLVLLFLVLTFVSGY